MYDGVPLLGLLCKPDNEYTRGPVSCLVCRLWAWDGVWWQLRTGERRCEKSKAVLRLLESAVFCGDLCFLLTL